MLVTDYTIHKSCIVPEEPSRQSGTVVFDTSNGTRVVHCRANVSGGETALVIEALRLLRRMPEVLTGEIEVKFDLPWPQSPDQRLSAQI